MIVQPDILVKSASEVPVAIVEIRSQRNLTAAIAQDIRKNLLEYGQPPSVSYFILLSQDRGYVWKTDSEESSDSPPDAEFSMHDVVRNYIPQDDPDRRFRGSELELIVMNWLWDLSTDIPRSTTGAEKVLTDLGLITAIRDGSVLVEPHL